MEKDKVLTTLSTFKFDGWDKIYTRDSLEYKNVDKARNAAKTHKLSPSEQIYLLIDNGTLLFPSDSVIITSKGISVYYKESLTKESTLIYKDWTRLEEVSLINGQIVFIGKNGYSLPVSSELMLHTNTERINEFLEVIKTIIVNVNKKDTISEKLTETIIRKGKPQKNFNKSIVFAIVGVITIAILVIITSLLISSNRDNARIDGEATNAVPDSLKLNIEKDVKVKGFTEQELSLNALSISISQSITEALNKSDSSQLVRILSDLNKLSWTDISGVDSKLNQEKRNEILNIQEQYRIQINDALTLSDIALYNSDNLLLETGENTYSYALLKGDSLTFSIESEKAVRSVKVFEEKTGNMLYIQGNKTNFSNKLLIPHSDVINVVIITKEPTYVTVNFSKNPKNFRSKNYSFQVNIDTLASNVNDKKASKLISFEYIDLFPEPYKVKLSSGWNSILSGESKVIVPVELPKNSTEMVYRLKISNTDDSNFGSLCSEVSTFKTSYKLVGYTVWESEGNQSNIFRELLNKLAEPNKEAATCNVYFIDNNKETMKFLKHLPFKYDVNNSIKNTQSRNGLIKVNKKGFVYLGFESTRFTKSTFVSLEAVALTKKVSFYRLIKHPVENNK